MNKNKKVKRELQCKTTQKGGERRVNMLELSCAKLRRLMKLSLKKFDEMIIDRLEAILKDS